MIYSDYSNAQILLSGHADNIINKALTVFIEEIEKRTGIVFSFSETEQQDNKKQIIIGLEEYLSDDTFPKISTAGNEGFNLLIDENRCVIAGHDSRGVLYGIGKLLRLMQWDKGIFKLPVGIRINETPKYKMRGHQLGYRTKTNAYDAWTPEIYEQYIRELAVFGANSIELMPPRTDDELSNPLMKYDSLDMLCTVSKIVKSYGMDVWMWYPNMFSEDIDEATLNDERVERHNVLKCIPYLDHIIIPGGDPGKLSPEKLFSWSYEVLKIAKMYHRNVKLWLTPQTGTPSEEWVEAFYSELSKKPEWLTGVGFAPWERDSLPILRKRTPNCYPIRNYPDISHTLRCQYPIAKWNMTMARTLGREFINPRPVDEEKIHNLFAEYADGSICYSEGINDDLNKFVWLSQDWNPDSDVRDCVNEYSRLFISFEYADKIADGIFLLEENLKQHPENNEGIERCAEIFSALESCLTGYSSDNYRYEMLLLRSLFDLYQKRRFVFEKGLEANAIKAFYACNCNDLDSQIRSIKSIFNKSDANPLQREIKVKLENLADLLFEHIGAQLTVSKHGASAWDRGAFMECIDIPLNDSRYILSRLDLAENMKTYPEKLEIIRNLPNRQNPGDGGFYDDFGSEESYKRLENHENYHNDPGFLETPLLSFLLPSPFENDDKEKAPLSWQQNISTLYQKPLVINYDNLIPNAEYTIRTVYCRFHTVHIRMSGGENGGIPIHDEICINKPFVQYECRLPKECYTDGKLRLVLQVRDGERGPNVSEIMIRKI